MAIVQIKPHFPINVLLTELSNEITFRTASFHVIPGFAFPITHMYATFPPNKTAAGVSMRVSSMAFSGKILPGRNAKNSKDKSAARRYEVSFITKTYMNGSWFCRASVLALLG
jgi:hypothetical protein